MSPVKIQATQYPLCIAECVNDRQTLTNHRKFSEVLMG